MTEVFSQNGIFVSSDLERRLTALSADNLLNDAHIAEVISGRNPETLDLMVDRLEQHERTELREKRKSSLSEVTQEFDLKKSGLSFKDIEELEELLDAGMIDVRDVKHALKHGNADQLREEIDRRNADRNHELIHERGRSR